MLNIRSTLKNIRIKMLLCNKKKDNKKKPKRKLYEIVSLILLIQVCIFSFAKHNLIYAGPVEVPIGTTTDGGISVIAYLLAACGIENCLAEPEEGSAESWNVTQKKQAAVYYLEEYRKAKGKPPEQQTPEDKTLIGAWSSILDNMRYQEDVDGYTRLFMDSNPSMFNDFMTAANIYKNKNACVLNYDNSCNGTTASFFNPFYDVFNPVTLNQICTSGLPYIIYKIDLTGYLAQNENLSTSMNASYYSVKFFYDKNVRIVKNADGVYDFNVSDVKDSYLNKSTDIRFWESDLIPMKTSNYYESGIYNGNVDMLDYFNSDNLRFYENKSIYSKDIRCYPVCQLYNVKFGEPYVFAADSPAGYVNPEDKIYNPSYSADLSGVLKNTDLLVAPDVYKKVGASADGFAKTTVTVPTEMLNTLELPNSLTEIENLPLNVTETGLVTVANPSTVPAGQPAVSSETVPVNPGSAADLDWSTRNDEGELDFSPLYADLKDKFPFCIPFDLLKIVNGWNVTKQAPSFNIEIPGKIGGTFTFDFSKFEKIIVMLRYFILVAFVMFLLKWTKNLMGGQ